MDFMTINKYLEIKTDDFVFRLEQINDKVFRIRRAVNYDCFKSKSLIILPDINAEQVTYETSEKCYSITTKSVEVSVDKENSAITINSLNGVKIFSESEVEIKKNENDYSVTSKIYF